MGCIGWAIGAVLFVIGATAMMVVTHVIFDIFSVVMIFVAAVLVVFGVIFGFVVALKNTIKVYRDMYGK